MSWDEWLQQVRQNKEERERMPARPVACPTDGTPLETGPRGELHCRWCGWTRT
jgi:hypothetical protein